MKTVTRLALLALAGYVASRLVRRAGPGDLSKSAKRELKRMAAA